MKINVVATVESHFGMPLEQVINSLHWDKKLSIREIADMSGVVRQSLVYACRRLNIRTRSLKEATLLTPNKGPKHWAWGLNKNNSDLYRRHSERMVLENPAHNKDSIEKAAKTRSKFFKKKLWPQEKKMRKILSSFGVSFEAQYPCGPYIMDFFIEHLSLCIEIDSRSKWGRKRKSAAKKRDLFFEQKGIKTLRIDKKKLDDRSFINHIFKTYNII